VYSKGVRRCFWVEIASKLGVFCQKKALPWFFGHHSGGQYLSLQTTRCLPYQATCRVLNFFFFQNNRGGRQVIRLFKKIKTKPRPRRLTLKAHQCVGALHYSGPGALGHRHTSLGSFWHFFIYVKYKLKGKKFIELSWVYDLDHRFDGLSHNTWAIIYFSNIAFLIYIYIYIF
jgi:hypothetical protein